MLQLRSSSLLYFLTFRSPWFVIRDLDERRHYSIWTSTQTRTILSSRLMLMIRIHHSSSPPVAQPLNVANVLLSELFHDILFF